MALSDEVIESVGQLIFLPPYVGAYHSIDGLSVHIDRGGKDSLKHPYILSICLRVQCLHELTRSTERLQPFKLPLIIGFPHPRAVIFMIRMLRPIIIVSEIFPSAIDV